MTFAGVTVNNQQVALVDYGYWSGDDVSSGLIGFAYPGITSAFPGTDSTKDSRNISITYDPFFFNAIEQKLVDPMFSLALNRETEGEAGQVALGGLPDVDFKGDFVSTPLIVKSWTSPAMQLTNFTYYTIVPDGYILQAGAAKQYFDSNGRLAEDNTVETTGNISNTTPVIIDSGSTLMSLPASLAAEVNALFVPPAVYIADEELYEVDCAAVPPTFGVRIAGQDFYVEAQDLLLTGEIGMDPGTGMCVTGIQPMPAPGPFILGDTFLKNVVAVFDVGGSEMRFAAR